MYRITDYSNFYRELPNIVFADKHWILDILVDSKKKNKKLKPYFKNAELSEKTLSFLLFRQGIPRGDLWNFIEWLEEQEFFFDYDAVFDRFDDTFLAYSIRARDDTTLEMGEIPLEVEGLLHHWNLWMDILHWTRQLCFNQPYWERFMEGGEAWSIPVLSDRSRW